MPLEKEKQSKAQNPKRQTLSDNKENNYTVGYYKKRKRDNYTINKIKGRYGVMDHSMRMD